MKSSVVDVHVQYLRANGYSDLKEWRNNPGNLYVGRSGVDTVKGKTVHREGSVWANPFKLGRDGDLPTVIRKYDRYIREKIALKEVDVEELRGKRLGCWCVKDAEFCFDKEKPLEEYCCHGEVLLKMLEETK
jgi:hypothetical protein